MSTINVNYMTRTYNNFLKGQETRKASGKSIADTITEKMSGNEKTGEVAEMAKTGEVSTKDMTMDEYKQYIHDKISEIPLHPTRMGDNIAINISEAGFEAMKNDPEYEAWVLDYLKKDFATSDPWISKCGGGYSVFNFGATKEEFHAQGWYEGYQNGNGKSLYADKSKNSFWERKIENKQRMEVQAKKQQERDRIEQEIFEKSVRNKRLAHQRLLADYQKREMTAGNISSSATISSTAMSQMATASYEASFMTADTMM